MNKLTSKIACPSRLRTMGRFQRYMRRALHAEQTPIHSTEAWSQALQLARGAELNHARAR